MSWHLRALEIRGIGYVPEEDRHGKAWHLLPLWFASNVSIVIISYAVAVMGLGLSTGVATVAVIVGTLLGAPITALHSAQGSTMGLPQMITSRAQFGLYGAILPTLVAFVTFFVFGVLGPLLAGPALGTLLGIGSIWGMIIFDAVCLLIAWYGYRLIHVIVRYIAVVMAVLILVLLIKYSLLAASTPATLPNRTNSAAGFILAVALMVMQQVSWAPLVADYSRYLPSRTAIKSAFWYTFSGAAGACILASVVGLLAATIGLQAISASPIDAVGGIFGLGIKPLLVIILVISTVPSQVETTYSSYACIATMARPRSELPGGALRARFATTFAIVLAMTLVATLANGNLVEFIIDASQILLYLLIPWSAINLVDFYLVRRGKYDFHSFFDPSVYGTVNWMSVAVYTVAVGAEVPFMSLPFWSGPIATAMGGADIAWIVGFIVCGLIYWMISRANWGPGVLTAARKDPVLTPAE